MDKGVVSTLQQMTPASEIRWKVQSVSKKGKATMVAYTDARYCRKVLNEAVGCEGWEVHYERDSQGVLFCKLSLRFKDGWVTKADCGVPSNFEAEKGEVSDAFKRACFAWGICEDLYDLDIHFVQCEKGYTLGTWKHPKRDWNPETKKATKTKVIEVAQVHEQAFNQATQEVYGDEGVKNLLGSELPSMAEQALDEVLSKDVSIEKVRELGKSDVALAHDTFQEHLQEWAKSGRNSQIGFTKEPEQKWMDVDGGLLYWMVTNLTVTKDGKPNANHARRISACEEILYRMTIGEEWQGNESFYSGKEEQTLKEDCVKILLEG